MKWMEQQERILQVQECYSREHMNSIRCHFIYVNLENSIEKISSERIELRNPGPQDTKTVISSEQVLQLIQSNRISTPTTKYIFQESFLFYVDLESENLQQFIQGDNFVDISKRFFQVLPLLDDIVIPPSIFVFHHLNGLYFLFKEVANKLVVPKSILKKGQRSEGTRKKGMVASAIMNLENILFNNIFCQEQSVSNGGMRVEDHQHCAAIEQEGIPLGKNKRVTLKLVPTIENNTGRKTHTRHMGRGTTRNTRKNDENKE
jgi:hypothetical protein